MSKEFEEIVLKKLGNLEIEVKDTKKGLQNLAKDTNRRLENLETEVKDTKKGLQNLAKNTNQRLANLETEAKYTKQRLEDLSVRVEQRIGELEIEVRDTGEVVKFLNQNFTKFDYEINKKIDTLFDSYTVSKEKDEVHEENIVSLNAKVFNQDIRISNLENKVLTA